MKWKKIGKIFDPTEHKLTNGFVDFAQSPQVLIFDDFVRIYFSTRNKSKNGKYLSHVQFVEMDKEFKKILNISKDSVIELGKPGCFDEHGIFPMNIARVGDKVYAYTSGWTRRVSVSVDTGIGLAISDDDGLTFKKIGDGPVLTSSLYEPFLVGDPFVKVIDEVFHMWYIYGTKWEKFSEESAPDRVYKIAHAKSNDGVSWEKDGVQIVSDVVNENECQALPTVIKIGEVYHMYFCYRNSYDFRKNKNNGYRLGYAYSTDLINWTRDDSSAGIDVSKDGWDSEMMCYPHIFQMDYNVYLMYNGNEFGRYGFGLAKLEN